MKHQEYQYLDLLKDVLKNGVKNVDRGTGAVSYSVFGRQTRYDLSQGFPLLTTKKVYWKGVLHELYWFMSGQSNIKYLVDNNVHIWDDYPFKAYGKWQMAHGKEPNKDEFIERIKNDNKFAEKWGNLPRIYGEMWRRWPTKKKRTIDQLQFVIDELKADPYARNLIVTSWNPEYLYTMATYEDASRFPICHNMYQISQKGGKLHLQLYQRSADLFLGVPFNIASYSLLLLVLSKITGYKPGEFVHTFGDAHIYANHIEQVKEQLKRKPKPFPKVSFAKKIKTISDFKPEDVILENYDPHPLLKGDLTVAGGFFERSK
ncbi:MAG TPA: thymidylate synthase [Candidatus Saccharimonadales bacterium]|nr:thymidylate synthase [Candidatus Saccharimonadales bacterium]